MHFPLPPPVGMRAFGSFALPYALTYVLWTVAGDVGGLISGLILGLVLAGAIIWVLFHPEQREAPVTFGAVTAGYVGAVLVGGFILWGANVLIFNILNEKQQAHTVPTSPFGPTFAWDAPEPDEPKTPTAPPRTPPRPSVAGTDLNAPQVSPPEVVGPSAVPPVAPPGPTPSTTAPSHVAVVETPETTPDESPFTATTKPVDAQGGTVKASVVDASQATPEAAPKGTTPVTVFDPEVEPNATSVPRDPESVVVEVVQSKLGVFDRIIYPFDDSGKWMAVVRRLGAGEDAVERWQLSPVMEKQGEVRFRHEPHVQDRYILSPNGDHLVRIVNWPRLSAQVWSFEAARVSRNIELDEKFGSPELVDFVGEDEFAIHWERGPTHGLEMWNARTFQRGKQVAVTAFDNSPGNLAISPEGRFIAMAAKGAGEAQLQIYDRVTTKALKRLPVISLDRRWPVRPSGLEFSPDGSKIAALFEQNNNGLIVCWKIADGRIVAEHIYPAGVLPDGGGAPQHGNDGGGGEVMIGNRNVATFVGHSGRAFEWLSSGDAW
ncbi:MAG: hypothetical protein ACREIT_11920, partial [Tepidisphaeraceae bacterium]